MYLADVDDTYKQPRSVWHTLNFFIFGLPLKKFTLCPWATTRFAWYTELVLQSFRNRFSLGKKNSFFRMNSLYQPRAQGGT